MLTLPDVFVSTVDFDHLYKLISGLDNLPDDFCHLSGELMRAVVLPPELMPGNVATMHSKVRFQNQYRGGLYEGTLVYPEEVDGARGKLSVISPVGTALLGLAVGDRIAWPISEKSYLFLRLVDVEQPLDP